MNHARRRVGLGLLLLVTLASCSTDSRSPIGIAAVSASADANGGGITLAISPDDHPTRIKVGESLQLTAALTNPAGHVVPSNRPVEWAILGDSRKGDVATLSSDGVLTGRNPGTVLVSATINQGTALAKYEVIASCGGRDEKPCCDPREKKCQDDPGPKPAPPAEPPPETKSP